jgi:membrane protease YdiL (CAAX protease family)
MPSSGYFHATRHPWPCLLFLLPLLLAYEGGIFWLGGTHPEAFRNGADTWLHWGLEAFGLSHLYWTPGLIGAAFLAWAWFQKEERPKDVLGVCTGMAIESMIFAAGLWGLNRGLGPLLERLGIVVAIAPPSQASDALIQVITFVGAGIYEEVLFRLLLFTSIVAVLRYLKIARTGAILVGAVAAALVFAGAHHAGPYGEAFDTYSFLFRTLAGLYFTMVFQLRGFGVAVGAHACYDVLVGVLIS